MRIFRIILCAILLAMALLVPPYLVEPARRDAFSEFRATKEPPPFKGTVVLYHIVSERTYAGSVTAWLSAQAEAFEKRHKGTYILVEGMTEPLFWERLENGRVPDAYSFFCGALYRDLLQPVGMEVEGLRSGLYCREEAIPYLYSGYAAIEAEAKAPLPEEAPIAACMAPARETGVIAGLRAVGDCLRDERYGMSYRIEPAGVYTDQVAWLGIGRMADANRAEALRAFFAFLCEEKQQQKLSAIGALSVLESVKDVVPNVQLEPVFQTLQMPVSPDPFLLYEQRDALLSDAEAARAGDAEAARRFRERMEGILGK